MNIFNYIKSSHSFAFASLAIIIAVFTSSCNDTKSYAEYLSDERKAVNYYLSNYRVINEVPVDTIFETVNDWIAKGKTTDEAKALAPYYRLNKDGEVYMQVVSPGNRKDNRAKNDQQIYFRFMRTNLLYIWQGYETSPSGNANDMSYNPTYFRYGNYSLRSSSQYGQGIQMPLDYLGIDCEVNLVIRSQYGIVNEIAEVTPYMYSLRYFPATSI